MPAKNSKIVLDDSREKPSTMVAPLSGKKPKENARYNPNQPRWRDGRWRQTYGDLPPRSSAKE